MASHALASNDQSPKLESRTSRSSSWGWPHLVSIQVKVADAGSSSRPSSMYNAEESEPSQELNDRTTPSQISLPLSPIHNDPDSDNSVGEEICPECEENQLSENNRTHFASSSNSLSSLSECGTVRARRSYLEGQLQHASSSENLRGRQSPPNELERPPRTYL